MGDYYERLTRQHEDEDRRDEWARGHDDWREQWGDEAMEDSDATQ